MMMGRFGVLKILHIQHDILSSLLLVVVVVVVVERVSDDDAMQL